MKHIFNIFIVVAAIAAFYSCGNSTAKVPVQSGIQSNNLNNSDAKSNDTIASQILFMKNGINHVDLNGDGIKDMVVSGYRGNISAHVFNYYTFYICDKNFDNNNTQLWNIVEIDGQDNYDICSHEGADGVLTDIAFIKNAKGKYQLLKADREFGESFADSGKVTFSYYSLKYDSMENRYIYSVKSKKISKYKYVDVKEAIMKECK